LSSALQFFREEAMLWCLAGALAGATKLQPTGAGHGQVERLV